MTVYQKTALLLCLLCQALGWSQVMIGDVNDPNPFALLELNTTKISAGLRLPQLTTTQRDALDFTSASNPDAPQGLFIYNSSTKCIEFWNNDPWISLCQGNAAMTFIPTPTPFPVEGGTQPVETVDKECFIAGDFQFVVLAGAEYCIVSPESSPSGFFSVTFSPNPTALTRRAVILVTNPCGATQSLIVTQEPNTEICGAPITMPTIASQTGNQVCGAAFLHLVGTLTGDPQDYIWFFMGREVGRGASYTATNPEQYVVYYKALGCDSATASFTLLPLSLPAIV